MALFDTIVFLAAFFVFGLVGQIIVLSSMSGDFLSKDIAGYFGFALGFMIFGFLYFKHVIDHLKDELKHNEDMLKTKEYIILELREKMKKSSKVLKKDKNEKET